MDALQKLENAIAGYQQSSLSYDRFEDQFRSVAQTVFAEREDVQGVIFSIEGLLAEFREGCLDGERLRKELANAIRPFAMRAREFYVVFSAKTQDYEFPRIPSPYPEIRKPPQESFLDLSGGLVEVA